jgi:hypothetical protein
MSFRKAPIGIKEAVLVNYDLIVEIRQLLLTLWTEMKPIHIPSDPEKQEGSEDVRPKRIPTPLPGIVSICCNQIPLFRDIKGENYKTHYHHPLQLKER